MKSDDYGKYESGNKVIYIIKKISYKELDKYI